MNDLMFHSPFSIFDDIFGKASSFDDFYEPANKLTKEICSNVFPPSDLYEDSSDGSFVIEAALAGCKEEDIQVGYEDNYVNVTIAPSAEDKDKVIFQRGIKRRQSESTTSYFVDPTRYDANEITVTFENGMLKIRVPALKTRAKKQLFGINGKAPKALPEKEKTDKESK